MQPHDLDGLHEIYTVSQLNNEVRFLLEDTFPLIWVEGEISNFAAPGSGHWYFSLKDAAAQVRCALFKGNQRKINFQPKDGAHVLIHARASLYPNRGEFQLIAEHMEERGEGKLRQAYELLKKKLEAAGLFAEEHKQPLPRFPRRIGVVTSPTGAAIRDILTVLKRRYPCVPVIIYPTLVQGHQAAPNIVTALRTANKRKECDVLILARGGGSLEDLWPFNEESVAHAIYASDIPIVSGIGHEVDFTIADFVADLRAATPSAAAEIVTPDQMELLQILIRHKQHLGSQMQRKLSRIKQHLEWVQKHLSQQHPKRRLLEQMQRLDFYEATLGQLQLQRLTRAKASISDLNLKLACHTPIHVIQNLQDRIRLQQQHLDHFIQNQLYKKQAQFLNATTRLNTLSPLSTLQRGYAIASVKDPSTNAQRILHDASTVSPGTEIRVRLRHGRLDCIVEHIHKEKD